MLAIWQMLAESLPALVWLQCRGFIHDLFSNGNGVINKPLFGCSLIQYFYNVELSFKLNESIGSYRSVGLFCVICRMFHSFCIIHWLIHSSNSIFF